MYQNRHQGHSGGSQALQIPSSDCVTSVEMKNMDNGDRVELYQWEFPIPGGYGSLHSDFFLPTPYFTQGVLSSFPWVQKFVSKYEIGSFRLEIPCPVLTPGSEERENFTWTMDPFAQLHFLGKLRTRNEIGSDGPVGAPPQMIFPFQWEEGGEIKCLMGLKSGRWEDGTPLVYHLPVMSIGGDLFIVEKLRLCIKIHGKSKQTQGTHHQVVKDGRVKLHSLVPAMFNKPDFSDIKLICGGETFYCHKSGSPIFHKMFMFEGKEGQVEIPDVDKALFKRMLQWMYGVDIRPKMKSLQETMDLLRMADSYLLDFLKQVLAEDVLSAVTAQNAFEIYVQAHGIGEGRLMAKATEVMKRHRDMFSNKELFDDCYSRFPQLLQDICNN